MNNATITGVITNIWNLSEGIYLGRIHSLDDDNFFYIYWNNLYYNNVELLDKYVCVYGNFNYIKVKTEDRVRKIMALNVRGIELHDF